MINLILAICCSTLVSLVMRVGGSYIGKDRNFSMLAVNYTVCVLLALGYTGREVLDSGCGSPLTAGLGAVNGLLYLLGFLLLQISTRRNGVVMSATFMRLGVLVPTVLSVLAFGEQPTALQGIGFLIALAAIVGISAQEETPNTSVSFRSGLILLLLSGGGADAMSKVFDEIGNPGETNWFLLCTFLFALLFSILLMLFGKQKLGKKELIAGVLLAFPNYYSARFLLKAVGEIPAVVAYPTFSVGAIILISVIGILFFHERISGRQKLALGGILVALVLLNI